MPPSTFRYRHLVAVTTGLTFVLILLGVYTAATASGLACSGQWPLCDDGLLPRSIPSLVEWTHRLVAMVTGIFILGTAAGAWRYRRDDRRLRRAATLAVVVLPVQVVLGGLTVGIYQPLVNTLHHAAALVIFGSLVAATAWAFDGGHGRGGRGDEGTGAAAGD